MLEQFPDDVITQVTDPRTGIQRRSKWPLSLIEWHHIVYHTDTADDSHHNLEPMLIKAHEERTAKIDIPQIAKTRRISKEHEEFRRRILTPRNERPAKRSRWPSRPFPKRNQ